MASTQAAERSPIGCTIENPSPSKFNAWCKKHKDIQEGEVVVEVPDDMVLMAENCSIQDLLEADGLTKPAEDALLEVQGLVLAVMFERSLGDKSKWGPYLSFLPNDLSHMMTYWTDDELSELVGTAAHDKLLGRVQHPADTPTRVRQLFDKLVVPFVCRHERVARVMLGHKRGKNKPTEGDIRDKLWQSYLWSTSAVASYSFVLGDDHYQGMVAVWDLLNHITGAVNVKLHHDPDKGVLQMIATQDIPRGSEVVNCYGHLSNAELLRGYGYVEQHNNIRHVQVPTHFCIKAAAAAAGATGAPASDADTATAAQAATAAANCSGKRTAAAAAAAAAASAAGGDFDDGSDAEGSEGPGLDVSGGSDVSGSEGDSSEGGDESSEGGDESPSEDSESEPDWDLEDDSPEELKQQQERIQQCHHRQQQQQAPDSRPAKKQKRQARQPHQPQHQSAAVSIPSLTEAQAQIGDWEDRWQLCFSLGLLPKNGVFQLPGGGLGSCPVQLLAVLLLLLGRAADCAALAAVLEDTTTAAAAVAGAVAAAAAADAAAKSSKGKEGSQPKSSSKKQKSTRTDKQQAHHHHHHHQCDPAGPCDAPLGGAASLPAEGAGSVSDVEQQLADFKFTSPTQLASALQQLVTLMTCRYSCSLQADLLLLQSPDAPHPARLAAAVLARSAEKEVWAELQQDLNRSGAAKQLMQRARACLVQAVVQRAEAAASTARNKHNCCGQPGCEHEHHKHEQQHEHEHEHSPGRTCKQQSKQRGGRSNQGKGSSSRPSHGAAGGGADAPQPAPAQEGFSFNFNV